MTSSKSARIWLSVLVGAVCALGGNAAFAQARVHHDILTQFNDPRGFITVSVDGNPANLQVTQATLSLASPDVNCADPSCPFVLNFLGVSLQNFTLPLTIGGDAASFSVQTPFVTIHGPVALTKSGTQIVIPAGTPAELSANLSGGTSSQSITPGFRNQTSGTLTPIVIRLDPQRQIATVDGVFDFSIEVLGSTVPASARFTSSNVGAFDNTPPVANAGPDLTVTCPGTVTLDGSASTDAQNNIVSYAWNGGDQGRTSGRGTQGRLNLGAGAHPVTLTVTDVYNSSSTDTMVVTVLDPPPTFTSVPVDVVSSTCGALNIGAAQAASPCETVNVTSDKPATFPAGVTVVTWTARTPSGKSSPPPSGWSSSPVTIRRAARQGVTSFGGRRTTTP